MPYLDPLVSPLPLPTSFSPSHVPTILHRFIEIHRTCRRRRRHLPIAVTQNVSVTMYHDHRPLAFTSLPSLSLVYMPAFYLLSYRLNFPDTRFRFHSSHMIFIGYTLSTIQTTNSDHVYHICPMHNVPILCSTTLSRSTYKICLRELLYT
jgi:hypothetical protein